MVSEDLSPSNFSLHHIEFKRLNNSQMAIFHIVLRDFAIVIFFFFERKSTVKVYCRSASPLYFSFRRMLLMVL
jgi:hypothetical protein